MVRTEAPEPTQSVMTKCRKGEEYVKAVVQCMPGATQVPGTAEELADLADHVIRANPPSGTSRDFAFVAQDLAVPPGVAAGVPGERPASAASC